MQDDDADKSPALSAAVLRAEDEHFVLLPCGVAEFGNFVSGLLGKPQHLKGFSIGTFDIGYQEIANVYFLVTERVKNQNEGSLSHFSIAVHYDNGTTITHNDIARFKDYHPTEDCYPVGVTLSFVYLIRFPAKSAPEKQTITVSIFSEEDERSAHSRKHHYGGLFEYAIEYTDRTWATDMEGLLKNHGRTFVEQTSRHIRILREYYDDILFLLSIGGFCITTWFWAAHFDFAALQAAAQSPLEASQFAKTVNDVIRTIASLVTLAVILAGLQRFSMFYVFIPRDSFIVLVERDIKRRERIKKRGRRRWFAVFATWAGSVASNVVATYITMTG